MVFRINSVLRFYPRESAFISGQNLSEVFAAFSRRSIGTVGLAADKHDERGIKKWESEWGRKALFGLLLDFEKPSPLVEPVLTARLAGRLATLSLFVLVIFFCGFIGVHLLTKKNSLRYLSVPRAILKNDDAKGVTLWHADTSVFCHNY